LMTFGLAIVEMIKKNSSRKNMISLSECVNTSGANRLFRRIFI
jgi:hypothetical protein